MVLAELYVVMVQIAHSQQKDAFLPKMKLIGFMAVQYILMIPALAIYPIVSFLPIIAKILVVLYMPTMITRSPFLTAFLIKMNPRQMVV